MFIIKSMYIANKKRSGTMEFRTLSIAKKFRNNNYFTDLED